jgi:hypothetical protein
LESKETEQTIKYLDSSRDSRMLRWIEASRFLEIVEPFMIVVAQGLGRLDINLIRGDQQLEGQVKRQHSSPATMSPDEHSSLSVNMMEQLTLSYLWVLGAYELVRSIDQRCRDNPPLLGNTANIKFAEIKHTFERLRVPLAKFEPSRRYKDTDSTIAWPVIHKKLGSSWKVATDVVISRRELSDNLLNLLEETQITIGSQHK